METKKIVMGVISVAVAIIVLMSMIPIFTDAGASEDTFTNEYYYTMDSIKEDSNVVISWTSANPLILTINDEDIDMSGVERGKSYTLIGSDNVIVRALIGNSTMSFQVFGANYGNSGNATEVTITLSDNNVVLASNRPDIPNYSITNTDVTEGVIINPDGTGDYAVMKRIDKPAYVLNDSDIILVGITEIAPNTNVGLFAKGTLDDGLDFSTVYAPADTTITYGTETATKSDVNNYVDLYLLDKFGFTISDGTNTVDATYSYFLVPSEVTAERSVHASPVESTLIGLIPLLMMVGIMLTAIGLFIAKYRKN